MERDDALAFQWFSRSAEQDFPAGVYHLADCYASGRGTATDIARAAELYQKAARLGDEDAMFILGKWYRDGKGLRADPEQARFWLRKAADAGVKEAAACLRALSGKAPGKGGEKRGGFFQKLFGKGD